MMMERIVALRKFIALQGEPFIGRKIMLTDKLATHPFEAS